MHIDRSNYLSLPHTAGIQTKVGQPCSPQVQGLVCMSTSFHVIDDLPHTEILVHAGMEALSCVKTFIFLVQFYLSNVEHAYKKNYTKNGN